MMREATSDDIDLIEAHLAQFPATTMFLRGNLLAHGVGWSDHPHSTRYFISTAPPHLQAVFGVTQGGYLLAEASKAPDLSFAEFADHVPALAAHGMTGDAVSVERTLRALGLVDASFQMLTDEPLMQLDLVDLPEATMSLRRATEADRALLSDWFIGYELDSGIAANEAQVRKHLEQRIEFALARDTTVRIGLDVQGAPCAMAALNSRVADIVQVGGVFVPRHSRSQGLGRRVTAALLREAFQDGARKAVLFAASVCAERAYRAIGFETIGTYRIALFSVPEDVGGRLQ
ncbi:MAG: GNAT family N-acetyltransferase [Pseudomonadota bacterium]